MNERGNRAGYKRALDNRVTMKRGLFHDILPRLENVSPLSHLGGNSVPWNDTGKRVLINGHREDYQDLSPILSKSDQSPKAAGKRPLSAKRFVVARIR